MTNKNKALLLIDGLINLILGILLLLFPFGIASIFGVPSSDLHFYPTILGGVIFGIGIALLIERFGYKHNIRGLGLGGAIVINFCGGFVLLICLLTTTLDIPLRGQVLLWVIAIIVLGTGVIELLSKSWRD